MEANYTLEIMVHGYRNPTHQSLGQALFRHGCCEGDRDLPCSPCDNQFQFCLKNITGEMYDGCEIGYMESELVAEDDDDLTFSPGDDIGGLTNPLLFSGESWPVSLSAHVLCVAGMPQVALPKCCIPASQTPVA